MELILHVAGRMLSNPGLAAAGILITRNDGSPLYEAGFFLGNQTTESAQYHGLLRGLDHVAKLNPTLLSIFVPEDFLIQHVTGQLLVANPSLEMLHEQAQLKLLRLGRWSIRKTPESEGRRAVELAANALQSQSSHVASDHANPNPVRQYGAPPSAPNPNAVGEYGNAPTSAPPPAIADSSAGAASSAAASAATSRTGAPHDSSAAPLPPDERQVHVQLSSPPRGECPAGDWCPDVLTIGQKLPAGICIHAAHAFTPTILAMLNTDANDFSAIPTLTIRCTHPGCPATFHLSPAKHANESK